MYIVRVRKATKCLMLKENASRHSRRVGPSAQSPELGELSRQSPSQAFCPLQGTEKLSEDKEIPLPGKVNSLVMPTTFSKSKFVTRIWIRDLSTIDKILESKASSENLELKVAIFNRRFFHIWVKCLTKLLISPSSNWFHVHWTFHSDSEMSSNY